MHNADFADAVPTAKYEYCKFRIIESGKNNRATAIDKLDIVLIR